MTKNMQNQMQNIKKKCSNMLNIFCIFYILQYVQYVQDRPSHTFLHINLHIDLHTAIWNTDWLYKIKVFGTYRYHDVPSTYWYVM
jgi:hypothetical protein